MILTKQEILKRLKKKYQVVKLVYENYEKYWLAYTKEQAKEEDFFQIYFIAYTTDEFNEIKENDYANVFIKEKECFEKMEELVLTKEDIIPKYQIWENLVFKGWFIFTVSSILIQACYPFVFYFWNCWTKFSESEVEKASKEKEKIFFKK